MALSPCTLPNGLNTCCTPWPTKLASPVASRPKTAVASTSRDRRAASLTSWQVPSDLWSHIKYVEMVVVVNNHGSEWGSDAKQTVQRAAGHHRLANSSQGE